MTGIQKRQRLLEAASALLAASPGRSLHTVLLNKGIFYLDLRLLRDIGEVFTHNTFVALHQGPVVAHYKKRLVRPLAEEHVAVQKGNGDALPIILENELEYSELSPEGVEAANEVGSWISDLSSSEASRFSHGNIGWTMAYNSGLGVGAKPNPINMRIAMQQIVGADPWMDDDLTDSQLKSFELIDTNQGVQW